MLFVGMERGIFASWDRGESWVDIRGDLPRVSVRGIRVQRQYNDLVIGTHGRGVWILDDIQPLVELAEALEQEVHVFTPRTATAWERWSRGSTLGQSTFTGTNPQPGAWIQFHLSETAAAQLEPSPQREPGGGGAAAFFGFGGQGGQAQRPGGGNVTVRITNAEGTLVKEFEHRGDATKYLPRVLEVPE